MNTTFKNALFLGLLATLSVGSLTGIHALTQPLISQRQEDERNQAYLDLLQLDSTAGFSLQKTSELPPSLSSQGVTELVLLQDETTMNVVGAVYSIDASGGWGGTISFQIGMKASMYSGFNIVRQSETRGIGDVLLNAITDVVIGLDVGDIDIVNGAINAYLLQRNLGATFAYVTRDAVVDRIEIVAQDYRERLGG
jgi:Na+-translocating ferredoxin:NAD+ oxidoreductase RnfG subunit